MAGLDEYLAEVAADEAFQARLEKVTGLPAFCEALASEAKARGYAISAEQIADYLEQQRSAAQLNDAELAGVAGGRMKLSRFGAVFANSDGSDSTCTLCCDDNSNVCG